MDTSKTLILVISSFLIAVIISRIVAFCFGSDIMNPNIKVELLAFAVAFLADAVGTYLIIRFGHGGGIAETFYVVLVKGFFFALFYLLSIETIKYFIREITNIIIFLSA